jgi:TolB-like protein/Flp pilus assembly protein TadD
MEIVHVLNMDVVEYSTLLITEQSRIMGELTRIVRSAPRFQRAEAEGKLIRIPTGDGILLIFFGEPLAPIECAVEICAAIKSRPELRLRMGIHSGPVNEIVDVNDRSNVAGAGVDMAQRVMDCGDAGHVLLSKRVAEDLAPYPRWAPHLHDLGECEVKHGRRISLVNFYTDEIGNPELPRRWAAKMATSAPAPRPNAKSIAVLPFENLSHDPGNAYFADGIQAEILARLSKIADLKVISRTSTQRYKSAPANLSEIAKQLGVVHILEGTVQRAGDQVRVNVQLINAENDSHLWADNFDRKLTDIFAVESEIAAKIATTLQAKLTGAEQHAIAKRPTENSEAHQAFLKGVHYWYKYPAPGFEKSHDYFRQAIDLDPTYPLGYVGLSYYYGLAAAIGVAAPEENWPKAEAAANKAIALDDTSSDACNAIAATKLYYYRDWLSSERYFRRGVELDPNSAEIRHHYGSCLIFFGRGEEGLALMQRAADLDPLALRNNLDRAKFFFFNRQYDRAVEQFQKTLELYPEFAAAHEWLGYTYEQKGLLKEAIGEWSKAFILAGAGEQAANLERTYAAADFPSAVRSLAEQRLDQLSEMVKRGQFVPATDYVVANVRLGEKEQAFVWLAKAVEERNRPALEIKVSPLYDPLRDDPRFEKLISRVMPAG